jgi:response regulator RpfG family c-di-GMP phosphodiesterase
MMLYRDIQCSPANSSADTKFPILYVAFPPRRNKVIQDLLCSTYSPIYAPTTDEACLKLNSGIFSAIIIDLQIDSDCQFVELCGREHPSTPILAIVDDYPKSALAKRAGVFDLIFTPIHSPAASESLNRAVRYNAITAERYDGRSDLDRATQVLHEAYRTSLLALARALEARDGETAGHSERVVAYSLRLGQALCFGQRDLIRLEQGALLHDVGKIAVPDAILLKPGPLTPEEQIIMRAHVEYGLRLIDGFELLKGARHVIGEHHEKYDGTGYPSGLRAQMIHINARIFSVADALDAILSDRPYRPAQPFPQARAEIVAGSGGHFDPDVVQAFLSIAPHEWIDMRNLSTPSSPASHVITREGVAQFLASLTPQDSFPLIRAG